MSTPNFVSQADARGPLRNLLFGRKSAPVCVGPECRTSSPLVGGGASPIGDELSSETAFSADALEVKEPGFRRELVKAARAAAKAGAISRKDSRKITVASFSPAFVEQARKLCVVQMAFSGSEAADGLPRTAEGAIDELAIDWEGFAAFLERIIPLILELIRSFGVA